MHPFSHRSLFAAVAITALFATGCGKSKAIQAALDKHKIDYGRCELMAEQKEVNGSPGWAAATACRVKLRQTIMTEVGEEKLETYEKALEAWKADHGKEAVEEAKKAGGASGGGATGGSGDGCPDGAACLNKCKSECEAKHGIMIDTAKMAACAKAGKRPDQCVSEATNQTARACFLRCRGL